MKKKAFFVAATDPDSVPGDCMVFESMEELKDQVVELLDLNPGDEVFIGKVEVVGPIERHVILTKIIKEVLKEPL